MPSNTHAMFAFMIGQSALPPHVSAFERHAKPYALHTCSKPKFAQSPAPQSASDVQVAATQCPTGSPHWQISPWPQSLSLMHPYAQPQ